MKIKKILLTGATGFLERCIGKKFHKKYQIFGTGLTNHHPVPLINNINLASVLQPI